MEKVRRWLFLGLALSAVIVGIPGNSYAVNDVYENPNSSALVGYAAMVISHVRTVRQAAESDNSEANRTALAEALDFARDFRDVMYTATSTDIDSVDFSQFTDVEDYLYNVFPPEDARWSEVEGVDCTTEYDSACETSIPVIFSQLAEDYWYNYSW